MDGRIREEDQACPFCPVKDAEIERLREERDGAALAFNDAFAVGNRMEAEIERLRARVKRCCEAWKALLAHTKAESESVTNEKPVIVCDPAAFEEMDKAVAGLVALGGGGEGEAANP
jgi:hypothetical protein